MENPKYIVLTAVAIAAGFAAGDAYSATRTWSNGWDVAPVAGDDIVIVAGDLDWNATYPSNVASWVQVDAFSGTVTFDMHYPGYGSPTNLTIDGDCVISNGTWTCEANPNGSASEENRLWVRILGSLSLHSNALITADLTGFSADRGPGAESAGNRGASHGGVGGGRLSGVTYGSVVGPATLGSGGDAGRGGGSVHLEVGDATLLDGALSANGQSGGNWYGAGAGGSIYLKTGTLLGTGTIRAKGGNVGNQGAGGGGRVAVVLTNGTDFGQVVLQAYGGTAGSAGWPGAAGTVYRQTSSDPDGMGSLIIDNNNIIPVSPDITTETIGLAAVTQEFSTIVMTNAGVLGIGPDDTLILTNTVMLGNPSNRNDGITLFGGALILPASYGYTNWFISVMATGSTFDLTSRCTIGTNASLVANVPLSLSGDLVVESGGLVTHNPNSDTIAYQIELTVGGDLTIEEGGAIDASEKGYRADYSPFGFTSSYASHGGRAGDGNALTTYGSIVAPTNAGAGENSNPDSHGGGVVILNITGTTTLNGKILANAGPVSSYWDGSGAGGSIWVTTSNMVGSGTIGAAGGDKSNGVRAGGGGRVSVILTDGTDFDQVVMSANGANAPPNAAGRGAAGTVYTRTADQAVGWGTLTITNAPVSTRYTDITTDVHGLEVGDVNVGMGGKLWINTTPRLTLNGRLTVTNGGTLDLSGVFTQDVHALTVNGTNFAPGAVYSVQDINDAVAGTPIAGEGFVNVGIPNIENRAPTGITTTNASFNGYLLAAPFSPSGSVLWGRWDGADILGDWEYTNDFGAVVTPGALATNLGLMSNTVYYYRFFATNSYAFDWAPETETLMSGEVWLEGTDTNAAEIGLDPGVITVRRPATATNGPIEVNYEVTGDAIPDIDYEALSGVVTLQTGHSSTTLVVTPIYNDSIATQTVVVTITGGNYIVGAPSSVTVQIDPPGLPPGYNVWVGDDASDSNSWSEGRLPLSSDDILLSGFSLSNMTWDTASGLPDTVASWTQREYYNGTVVISTKYPGQGAFTNFTITGDCVVSNGTWTHTGNPNTAPYQIDRLHVTVGGNLVIATNGSINVESKGFYNRRGPGGGTVGNVYGGSHAGRSSSFNVSYGSLLRPINLGSGGGSEPGGGAIRLIVSGAAVIDGLISANGLWNGDAMGAGGSVWLAASTLSGSGIIRANGDSWDNTGSYRYSTGGRVAVELSSGGFDAFDAAGGMIIAHSGSNKVADINAACGTVHRRWPSGKQLLLDNGGILIRDSNDMFAHIPPFFQGNATYPAADYAFEDYLKDVTVIVRNNAELQMTTNAFFWMLVVDSTAERLHLGDSSDVLTVTRMSINGASYARPGDYTTNDWNGWAVPANVTGSGTIRIEQPGSVILIR